MRGEDEAKFVGFEQKKNANCFDISMFEGGSEGSGFHTKNNPKDPYQRAEVMQRTGRGMDVRCTLVGVVHGAMSADSKFWATLLVFEFRFDPTRQASRVTEATIELQFHVSDAGNEDPVVDAVSFDGNYSLVPSKQTETIVKGGDGNIQASYGANINASAKWMKTVSRETTDATTISGGKLVLNNTPPNRIAKWTLLENQTLKTGIPALIRAAVRIRRLDEAEFHCIPRLKCKADMRTRLISLFGCVPVDDPVLFKPDTEATGNLKDFNKEELGSVDLQQMSDITVTTMIKDAQK